MKNTNKTEQHSVTINFGPVSWKTLMAIKEKCEAGGLMLKITPTGLVSAIMSNGLRAAGELWKIELPKVWTFIDE